MTAADADPADEVAAEIRRDRGRPVVAVTGELDGGGRALFAALLAHVRTTCAGPVAVDLAGVSFADAHGLSPALRRDVVLVAVSPAVARLLRHLGIPPRGVRGMRGWAVGREPAHRCGRGGGPGG